MTIPWAENLLPASATISKLEAMSASELLDDVSKMVRQLPPAEREEFFDGLFALRKAVERPPVVAERSKLRWPDIQERHRRIFGDRVLSENIVLAERGEGELQGSNGHLR
jgi:hypothetical protein